MIRDAVDRSWLAAFAVDGARLREPGVRVIDDAPGLAGYNGLYLLRLGDGCTIGAPPDVADHVRALVDGVDADAIFSREAALRLAGDHALIVLGPSRHAYVDAASFVAPPACDAHRVAFDDERIARFRAEIDPDEWSEGGFHEGGDAVWWGAFEDDRLVAMGNMTDFNGVPGDVGIVTHPSARSRGLGKRLAGAMIADALAAIPVVRYRALFTNAASIRVADALGFVPDGSNIAVRMRPDR